MVATGNYVNVFNEKYDIFVILNEVNKILMQVRLTISKR